MPRCCLCNRKMCVAFKIHLVSLDKTFIMKLATPRENTVV